MYVCACVCTHTNVHADAYLECLAINLVLSEGACPLLVETLPL